jgi:hypothetical protein
MQKMICRKSISYNESQILKCIEWTAQKERHGFNGNNEMFGTK